MELLFNDLSIHGQFPDVATFQTAVARLMKMRSIAQRFQRELHCNRNVSTVQVTQELSMQQAIQAFGRNERQAIMQWLNRLGPFWDDARSHGRDDYFQYKDDVVTDTAVGEAAYRVFGGVDCRLVNLTPSSWMLTPLSVIWRSDTGDRCAEIINHWAVEDLEAALVAAPVPVSSWMQLAAATKDRCKHLVFSDNSFEPLRGHPYADGVARRVIALLDTLDRFKCSFDENGQRTPEGHRISRDYFNGDKAWFSSLSITEQNQFRSELTFRHPTLNGQSLFCPWHGKVKTPQYRVHFSWPISATEPLYVVYIGPKITKT